MTALTAEDADLVARLHRPLHRARPGRRLAPVPRSRAESPDLREDHPGDRRGDGVTALGPAEMAAPDVNVFLTRKIMRFARWWRAIANEHLSRIGHTQARWEALYWIAVSQGGATQRELAECVGIEEPTLVRMLHRLEQEGLVERRASQADRRTKTIVLTKAAEPHLKAMSGVIDKLRVDVLRNLSDDEIKQTVDVLDRMLERLERP